MKRLLTVLFAVALLAAVTPTAEAAIGWAGQIWPVHEATVLESNDVGVYFQIWKSGVTDQGGQGAGISATLYYGPSSTGPWTSVPMYYNTDVGSNDEYTEIIPSTYLNGKTEVWFYCEGYDSTDASTYTGAQDQNSNDPPFKLNITPALNQDVEVYFFLCMPPPGHPDYAEDPGEVCVIGDAAPIGSWATGVTMYQPCPVVGPRFYEVHVTFPQGSNPSIQYKYRRYGCDEWEWVGNRMVTIDDSNGTFLIPWVDHWNNYEGDDCTLCSVGVESATWGKIKNIYK
jgi:hypothetical protein